MGHDAFVQGRTRESSFSLSDSSRHGISPGHLGTLFRSLSSVRSRYSRSKGFSGANMNMGAAHGSTGDLDFLSQDAGDR